MLKYEWNFCVLSLLLRIVAVFLLLILEPPISSLLWFLWSRYQIPPPKCSPKAPAMSRWLSQVYPALTHVKNSQEKKKRHSLKFQYPEFDGTHRSISNDTLVGPELRVDIGEKPGERAALESGSQGFSSGNIPDVYSWVLLKEAHQYKFRVISPLWRKLAYKERIN